jgi:integrase
MGKALDGRDLGDGIDQRPSGLFRARYRDADGRQHSQHFEKITAARAWRGDQMSAVRKGAHVSPSDRTTVEEFAERWIASRPHRAATSKRYGGMLREHLRGTDLGRMRVTAVKPMHVQAWVTSRTLTLAPSTLDRTYTFVQSIFKAAVEHEIIVRTPCRSTIERPRGEKAERRTLDASQMAALVDATPERYRALVVLLATCGLRIGEALGLKVDDIDRERQVLRVRRQLDQRARTLAPLKTTESRREVPVPAHVLRALAAHRLAFPPYVSDDDLSGLLFTGPRGGPLRYDVFAIKVFRPAAEAAGLAGLTPHGLRHSAGSTMLHHGVPPATVGRVLGHSVAVLLSTYAHALPSGDDLARRAMEQARPDVSWAVSQDATAEG